MTRKNEKVRLSETVLSYFWTGARHLRGDCGVFTTACRSKLQGVRRHLSADSSALSFCDLSWLGQIQLGSSLLVLRLLVSSVGLVQTAACASTCSMVSIVPRFSGTDAKELAQRTDFLAVAMCSWKAPTPSSCHPSCRWRTSPRGTARLARARGKKSASQWLTSSMALGLTYHSRWVAN